MSVTVQRYAIVATNDSERSKNDRIPEDKIHRGLFRSNALDRVDEAIARLAEATDDFVTSATPERADRLYAIELIAFSATYAMAKCLSPDGIRYVEFPFQPGAVLVAASSQYAVAMPAEVRKAIDRGAERACRTVTGWISLESLSPRERTYFRAMTEAALRHFLYELWDVTE